MPLLLAYLPMEAIIPVTESAAPASFFRPLEAEVELRFPMVAVPRLISAPPVVTESAVSVPPA